MLFDVFCECTCDLSTGTETEMKKYTKRNIWSKGKHEEKDRAIADRSRHSSRSIGRSCKDEKQKGRGLADRSRLISRSIGRSFKERNEKPEGMPIDRAKLADRSAQLRESDRSNADRSWHASRSIGSQRFLIPHERR